MRAGGFVKKVISWAQRNEELKIVDDQIGNPTWARLLATISSKIIANTKHETLDFFDQKGGIYNLAGGGFTSRYEWTKAIFKFLPQDQSVTVKKITPVKSSEFQTPATRPLFSALNCEKFEHTFSVKIPPWETSLQLMLEN